MKKKHRAPRKPGVPAAASSVSATATAAPLPVITPSSSANAAATVMRGPEPAGVTIHDYEKNQTILLRWYNHNKDKPWFWRTIAVLILGPLVVLVLWNWFGGSESQTAQDWRNLAAVSMKKATELEKVAEDLDKRPVAPWAWLQLADRSLGDGVDSLPSNPDSAEGSLDTAEEAYGQVVRLAPENSTLARLGQFGLARTLEAKNELKKAADAYREVTKNSAWKDTDEAKQAEKLIELLEKPETQKFYQDLYAYKPSVANPPGDTVSVPPPPGSPKPSPLLPDVFDPKLDLSPKSELPALPDNVFQPEDKAKPAESKPDDKAKAADAKPAADKKTP